MSESSGDKRFRTLVHYLACFDVTQKESGVEKQLMLFAESMAKKKAQWHCG